MRQKTKLFKSIPELDAQIRTIEMPDDKDKKENYFIVEVGLYESVGEQGMIRTEFYDNEPTEAEIIEDTKQALREDYEEYKSSGILTGREERYLDILERIFGGVAVTPLIQDTKECHGGR